MEAKALEDDFIVVKSKKTKANKPKKASLKFNCDYDLNEKLDIKRCEQLKESIFDYKLKLMNNDQNQYWLKFRNNLKDFIEYDMSDTASSLNIVSYGLGSLDHNLNSRYQFALLLLIIDELKLNLKIDLCHFYDPIFNLNDKYLIENLFDFNIMDNNNEAKCCINEKLTLFYMPHVGKPLYNNLLFSNWTVSNLNKLYLIGNSFDFINTMTLNEDLVNYYKYIRHSLSFINEVKLCSKCQFTDAFSDLSLHKFKPCEDIIEINLEEPFYELNDEILFAK
jgi:hypothetical protein